LLPLSDIISFMRVFFIFLLVFLFSYGFSEKEKETLLRVIQGLYQDRVYNVAAQKCREYLEKTPADDEYREKIINIMLHSLFQSGNKKGFMDALQFLKEQKISPDIAKKAMALGLKLFKDDPEGKAEIIRFYIPFAGEYEKKQLYLTLAGLYYRAGLWDKILKLPDDKKLNFYKVIALYKLGRYTDVISFTDTMGRFEPEDKDNVLYYRGLAFFKLGNKEKAVEVIQAITFKTPEMVKFLANFYLKEKNYLMAQRYLKVLTLEKGYEDFAYYYLGVIYDLEKKYKKAAVYYQKAAKYSSEFGKLARERLSQLKKAGVIKGEKFYTVRIILYLDRKKAEEFIKKNSLKNCFVRKYKKYYGVYCGMFENREDAEKERESFRKKGFKDAVIDAIVK